MEALSTVWHNKKPKEVPVAAPEQAPEARSAAPEAPREEKALPPVEPRRRGRPRKE